MSSSYIYLIIFFCIAYLIITDQSVAKGFYMLTQLARVQYEKVKWWVQNSPANPIVRYFIWRRSMKMAKELMEELAEKNKNK
jgi:hypothetical protein